MKTLLDASLLRLAGDLERGRTSAVALTRQAQERHGEHGELLDAYQEWNPDRALADARAADEARSRGAGGPLGGLPISVKDLFGVAGYPTWAGTPERLPERWEEEGPLVAELRRQHGVVIGKTRMVELAFGGIGANPHWGTPRNPWDVREHRVPGGSSSGAGVSLHEGSAVLALGTDTACSVRTPACWTGTVGLKVTRDRWSRRGLVPLSPTYDSVGLLTRSVEDACFAFASLDPAGVGPGRFLERLRNELAGVRIGLFASEAWDLAPDDVAEPVRRALVELEAAGARQVDLELPEFDRAYDHYVGGLVVPPEIHAFLARELPAWMERMHPIVATRVQPGERVTASAFLRALAERAELVASCARRWDGIDVLATPTVPMTAPRLADVEALEDYARLNRSTSRGTNPVNVLGLCAITLPCGLDAAGLPVGLQLVAPANGEERLLGVALAAERLLGEPRERLGPAPLA